MVSMLIVSIAVLAASPQQGRSHRRKTSQPADPADRAEYLAMRAKTPDTADAHWKLGLWCERKG